MIGSISLCHLMIWGKPVACGRRFSHRNQPMIGSISLCHLMIWQKTVACERRFSHQNDIIGCMNSEYFLCYGVYVMFEY
jgi:hypothetical protein